MVRGPDNTLVVSDINGRVTVLSATGEVLSMKRLPGLPERVVGVLGDGSVVGARSSPRAIPPSTVQREPVTTSRTIRTAAGEPVASIDGLKRSLRSRVGGRVVATAFAPDGHEAVHDSGSYWGFADTYRIVEFSPSGELRRIVRRAWSPEPVTEADKDAFRAGILAGNARSPNLPSIERSVADAVFPRDRPAFSALLVDRDGFLWVKDYERTHHDPSVAGQRASRSVHTWTVFDPNGRWLTSVQLPANLEGRDIGSDYVLGWATDETGVPRVVVYNLAKGRQ